MKRIRSLLIGTALLAAMLPALASAQPAAGWTWTPACYLVGRIPATFTTNLELCRKYQRPIFYTWFWKS